jgi:hypothetical protein
MIDWFNLAANALWILACSLLLATLGYASWSASLRHEKLRKILVLPNFQTPMNIAGILFCFGLAGTSNKWWEIMLWLIVAALFTAQTAIIQINNKK